MAAHSKHRNPLRPQFSVHAILSWADAHHGRTGAWPTSETGALSESPGETWRRMDTALRLGRRVANDLRVGLRGMPGRTSLARTLTAQRGVRHPPDRPPLTQHEILAWADAHHGRTGAWPTSESGALPEAPGETWRGIDTALRL